MGSLTLNVFLRIKYQNNYAGVWGGRSRGGRGVRVTTGATPNISVDGVSLQFAGKSLLSNARFLYLNSKLRCDSSSFNAHFEFKFEISAWPYIRFGWTKRYRKVRSNLVVFSKLPLVGVIL